jgi:hypothetical protein
MEDRMTMLMKARETERLNTPFDIRQVKALEQIADTLFLIHAEMTRMRARAELSAK